MKIEDLKENINTQSLSDDFLILKYTDVDFIANQYIDAIAKYKNKEKVYLDSIEDLQSLFEGFCFLDSSLYILHLDKLEKSISNSKSLNNVIIVCKTIESKVEELLKNYIVVIPKLQQWQIEDYLKVKLEGLSNEHIKWLCSITNYNINRLENEIEKLSIFPKDERLEMFNLLNKEGGYNDLSSLNVFNFTSAILQKNKKILIDILIDKDSIDLEPAGIVTILLKNVKQVIDIQSIPNVNAEKLKMSNAQFYAIKKNNCGYFTTNALINIYEKLTDIDYQLKSGKLEYNRIIDTILKTIFTQH